MLFRSPDPYRVEAQGDQARCQQNWDEALSYYREAMDIHRANRSDLAYAEVDLPLLYFKLAQVQAITDDLEGALASLQEAIGRDPLYGYLPPFSDRQYSPLGEPDGWGSQRQSLRSPHHSPRLPGRQRLF